MHFSALQKIDLIHKWDYVPTVDDFISAHVYNSKKSFESQVLYLNKIFRFVDLPGNSLDPVLFGDARNYFNQLGIVVFMVSLADYVERCDGYPSKLHRSLAMLIELAMQVPQTTRKLFIYFNKVG